MQTAQANAQPTPATNVLEDANPREDFPPLPSPSFTVVESHAEQRKKRKGKDKEKAKNAGMPTRSPVRASTLMCILSYPCPRPRPLARSR